MTLNVGDKVRLKAEQATTPSDQIKFNTTYTVSVSASAGSLICLNGVDGVYWPKQFALVGAFTPTVGDTVMVPAVVLEVENGNVKIESRYDWYNKEEITFVRHKERPVLPTTPGARVTS